MSRESLTSALNGVVVGVDCTPSPSPNDRCIAELATNLLARLYPRIAISAEYSFGVSLRQLAARINPLIEFEEINSADHLICVGDTAATNALYPSASGWVARVTHEGPQESGAYNPYAAAASAALACAELFRLIFLKRAPEGDVSLSLLNFSRDCGQGCELESHDIGEVIFVGVGAVGNAAIWALAHDVTARGRVILVEPEELALSNLQRYVLGSYKDVSKPKVKLAERCLRCSALTVDSSRKTLEEFARQRRTAIPTICISADNIAARRSAQALLPRLVVNGWTGEQSLGNSWHIFSRDAACLACLYHPHGQGASAPEQAAKALGLSVQRALDLWITRQPLSSEDIKTAAESLGVSLQELAPWRGRPLSDLYTDVVCGAVPLDVKGVGRVETVPLAHQSVLAGILMAAELVKRTIPALAEQSQTESLASWDDVLKAPPTNWLKPRPREAGCICSDSDYQAVYTQKWGTSL